MILHIVRSGETIRVIADNYQCEESDITSNNLHITDYKNLKPGMKLRIPFLTKPIMETLEETESFISDYYPNLNNKFNEESRPNKKEENIAPKTTEVKEEAKEEIKVNVKEEMKTEELKEPFTSFPRYINNCYSGNIVPKIPETFIKKI